MGHLAQGFSKMYSFFLKVLFYVDFHVSHSRLWKHFYFKSRKALFIKQRTFYLPWERINIENVLVVCDQCSLELCNAIKREIYYERFLTFDHLNAIRH